MFHVCRELTDSEAHEKYLRSGCTRGSNAMHKRLCRIRMHQTYACDACGESRWGQLLWVCQHRRPRPDMRGMCLECASLALCEDRGASAGPNLVAQNSHTVAVTSLFCMKLAREVQHIAQKIPHCPEYLYIVLEGKFSGHGVDYNDAVLYLDRHIAIIIENEMSRSMPAATLSERMQQTLKSPHGVEYGNTGQLVHVDRAHTKFAVQLRLARAGDADGAGVLWWLGHGDRGARLLPDDAFTEPIVEKNFNVTVQGVSDRSVQCEYTYHSGAGRMRRVSGTRTVKIAGPRFRTGLAAVHAPDEGSGWNRSAGDDDYNSRAGLCALCGVPVARTATCLSELELIAATEGEPVRDPLCRRAYAGPTTGLGPLVLCLQCGRTCAALPPVVDAGTRAWETAVGTEEDRNPSHATQIAQRLFPSSIPFIEQLAVSAHVREDFPKKRKYVLVLAQCPFELLRTVFVPRGSLRGFDAESYTRHIPPWHLPVMPLTPYTTLEDLARRLRPFTFFFESYPCVVGTSEYSGEYQIRERAVYQACALLYTKERESWTPVDNVTYIQVGMRVRAKTRGIGTRRTPAAHPVLYVDKIFRNREGAIVRIRLSHIHNTAPAQNTRSVTAAATPLVPVSRDDFSRNYELHDRRKDAGDLYQLYRDKDDAVRRILAADAVHSSLAPQYAGQNKSVHVLFVKVDEVRDVFALPRVHTLQRLLQLLWVDTQHKTHSVAMQLRAMGHIAFSYIQPRLKRVWGIDDIPRQRDIFLSLVWDLYVAHEAANRVRDPAFVGLLAHIFPARDDHVLQAPVRGSEWAHERQSPEEHVEDILGHLETWLGQHGRLYTVLVRRAKQISPSDARGINPVQGPGRRL